jgi:DNA-binding transcriptional MerR regulator
MYRGQFFPEKFNLRRFFMKRTFSIGDTARITRITEKQLRHWEEQNYLSDIERVVCGERSYRRFSEAQIQQISKMREYLDMGYTLKSSAKLAKDAAEKQAEEVK